MAVGAVAGTKFYIAPVAASPSPDTYVEVKNIANLGDLVMQFSKIAVESVGDGYTRQIKGTQSTTPMTIMLNRDDTDPGQIALKAAFSNRNSLYPFKIIENDIVVTATTSTFTGRVYNSGSKYGAVNALKQLSVDIEVEPDSIVVVEGT
jgi:hypothetical protein